MKKLIFFILIGCLLYSCDKFGYRYLPQDKIPLLRNNDIVSFQDSISNKIEIFRVDVKDDWLQTPENTNYQIVSIFYNKLDQKTPFLIFGVTSKSTDGASYIINNYNTLMIVYSRITNFTINGVIYPTVDIAYDKSTLIPDTIPNKLYITYRNGVIRYEYKDGRVYNLVSK